MENIHLKLERKSYIYIVTLENPDNANLMDREFFIELKETFERLDEDPEVRTVIINSSSDDFCLGLDLESIYKELKGGGKDEDVSQSSLRDFVLKMHKGIKSIEECKKPVIAAINGKCYGSGLCLAAACDIRLGQENTVFSLGELSKGIILDAFILKRLSPIIGSGYLRELTFTTQEFDSNKAFSIGLLNNVFTDKKDLLLNAFKMAETIVGNVPLCVQSNKKVITRIVGDEKECIDDILLDVNSHILGLPCINEVLNERKK